MNVLFYIAFVKQYHVGCEYKDPNTDKTLVSKSVNCRSELG